MLEFLMDEHDENTTFSSFFPFFEMLLRHSHPTQAPPTLVGQRMPISTQNEETMMAYGFFICLCPPSFSFLFLNLRGRTWAHKTPCYYNLSNLVWFNQQINCLRQMDRVMRLVVAQKGLVHYFFTENLTEAYYYWNSYISKSDPYITIIYCLNRH